MPGWDGYPVRDRFSARYGAPVWVDNDVNLLALGEWRSGIAQGQDNVVVIKVGTGIGAGIIAEGRLHRGAQGSAGDVGHIQVVDDTAVICRCGNIGCLEALAGGAALAREGACRRARRPKRAAAPLAGAARQSDRRGRRARRVVRRPNRSGDAQIAGRRIGLMLASVVNFFNPSLIVIGGGVAQSGDQLLAAIRETVYRRSLPLATRELLIQRSSLAGLAGAIGASAMVVDELFSREQISSWAAGAAPFGMPEVAAAS